MLMGEIEIMAKLIYLRYSSVMTTENELEIYEKIIWYGFEHDDFIPDVYNMLLLLNKYNMIDLKEELDKLRDKYKRGDYYRSFCFFFEGIEMYRRVDNRMIIFFEKLLEIDFEDESFLFLQKIIRLVKGLLFLHSKRVKIERIRRLS